MHVRGHGCIGVTMCLCVYVCKCAHIMCIHGTYVQKCCVHLCINIVHVC